MKTNQQIHTEARQLMVLGSQFQNEQRLAGIGATEVAMPRILMNFPINVESSARERHIEAAMVGGALVYRLMEREADSVGEDRSERDGESSLVEESESAYDVLHTGYELGEEDRLTAQLGRFAERTEEQPNREAVAEVQAIVESDLLSPADQIRTKTEAVDFLAGRLDRRAFVSRVIERQCSRAEGRSEQLAERHEFKLTIGEP